MGLYQGKTTVKVHNVCSLESLNEKLETDPTTPDTYSHAVGVDLPVIMSSMAPSFPSLTSGDTCFFFNSAIRSTC